MSLMAGGSVGAVDGYGSWPEAVAAAHRLSIGSAGAVGIFDADGRLYIERLTISAAGVPLLLQIGRMGERAWHFRGQVLRGIVDGPIVMSRGDDLVSCVPIPRP